jgi:hypothetical protein
MTPKRGQGLGKVFPAWKAFAGDSGSSQPNRIK